MNKYNYKINDITRKLNINSREFFRQLDSEGFVKKYGSSLVKKMEEWISGENYFILPMYTPNISLIKYKDCFLNTVERKLYSLEDYKDEPLYEVNENISNDKPEFYIQLLETCGIKNIEEFRISFGNQIRPKQQRHKALLLHGLPSSGKSTILHPFTVITKSVCYNITSDSGFSWANTAKYPYSFSPEFNCWDINLDTNNTKQVLEGVNFNAKVKGKEPVEVIRKNVVVASNDKPKKDTIHEEAIYNRLDIFNTGGVLEEQVLPSIIFPMIENDIGKIISWCIKSNVNDNWVVPKKQ